MNRFGRRTLLIWGQLTMGLFLCLFAVMQLINQGIAGIAFIVLFVISFQVTIGPVSFIYVAETASDRAIGIC